MNKTTISSGNVTRFKEILLELHRGAAPSTMFEQFHDVITSATAEEYEEITQQMIREGISGKQAKKWRKRAVRAAQPAN